MPVLHEKCSVSKFDLISSYLITLYQVIERNYNLTSKTSDPPSAAILAVYLDQAHALPVRKGCVQECNVIEAG